MSEQIKELKAAARLCRSIARQELQGRGAAPDVLECVAEVIDKAARTITEAETLAQETNGLLQDLEGITP